MTRRERLEARATKRREWAASRTAKAEAAHQRVHEIADLIPLGQPILVGHHSERRHRRDIARIESGMEAAVENSCAAQAHEQAADGIDAQLATSIFSDDDDAVERLEEKIARLEAKRDRVKAYNASCRKGQRDVSLLDEAQQEDLATIARVCPYQLGNNGAGPSYWTSNTSAEIRRCKQRLAQIKSDTEKRDAGERGMGRAMLSRFSSACADCGETIEKDSPIVYYRLTREAVHDSCAREEVVGG